MNPAAAPPTSAPRFGTLHRILRRLWPDTPAGRWAMAGIIAVSFGLRAARLTDTFPITGYEAIYLRWAEIIDHQGQWFISLIDAKPPLQSWVLGALRIALGGDPLLQARLASVGAGLLSTVGIFAIGKRLGGDTAGLTGAALYAVFPFAVLYDRLAYTEAFVNLAGIALVLASLFVFGEVRRSWVPQIMAGVALGLGLLTKQTVLLFAYFPVVAGLWLGCRLRLGLFVRWVVIYSIAALFFAFTWIAAPQAPGTDSRDLLVHRTDFVGTPDSLLDLRFPRLARNLWRLRRTETYFPWPTALASMLSLLYLSRRGSLAAWVLISVAVLPLFVQCLVLSKIYPMRWAFPHFWPFLAVIGLAAADLWGRFLQPMGPTLRRHAILALAGLVVAGPMLYQAQGIVREPHHFLHPADSRYYHRSHAYSGFGNSEAVDYLLKEARNGPLVLLTDPIPGPPADAMFAYLNQRNGIRVYEALWTELAPDHPILPPGPIEIMRSRYEREKVGVLDFSKVSRVFYVTDSYYHSEEAVRDRQKDALLVASFPKPMGEKSVDVYRLN